MVIESRKYINFGINVCNFYYLLLVFIIPECKIIQKNVLNQSVYKSRRDIDEPLLHTLLLQKLLQINNLGPITRMAHIEGGRATPMPRILDRHPLNETLHTQTTDQRHGASTESAAGHARAEHGRSKADGRLDENVQLFAGHLKIVAQRFVRFGH